MSDDDVESDEFFYQKNVSTESVLVTRATYYKACFDKKQPAAPPRDWVKQNYAITIVYIFYSARLTRSLLVCSPQIRHIDQITLAKKENDKCTLINTDLPKIRFVGGGTFTYGALEESQVRLLIAGGCSSEERVYSVFYFRKSLNLLGSTVRR